MHQEQIDIIQVEVVQRVLKRLRYVVGVVLVVPELGGDEKLVTGHSRLLDSLSYGLFCSITAASCQRTDLIR